MADRQQADRTAFVRSALLTLPLVGAKRSAVAREIGAPSWRIGVNATRWQPTASVATKAAERLGRQFNVLCRFLGDVSTPNTGCPHMDASARQMRALLYAPVAELAAKLAGGIRVELDAAMDEAACMANIDPEARERMRAEGRPLWRLPTDEEIEALESERGGWGTPPRSESNR